MFGFRIINRANAFELSKLECEDTVVPIQMRQQYFIFGLTWILQNQSMVEVVRLELYKETMSIFNNGSYMCFTLCLGLTSQ